MYLEATSYLSYASGHIKSAIIYFVLAILIIVALVLIFKYLKKKADGTIQDNKLNSFAKNEFTGESKEVEIPTKIGATSLDKFFVECVLAGYNDFSKQKNIEKAKIIAKKYNLSFNQGIEQLYIDGKNAHAKLRDNIEDKKRQLRREEEEAIYGELNKFADCYGTEKKTQMLMAQKNEIYKQIAGLNKAADFVSRAGFQSERNWGTWGGIASGIAGPVAGAMVAMDVQAENERIRQQNMENMKRAMPAYMSISNSKEENRKKSEEIQKEINEVSEKLVSNESTSEVMDLLSVEDATIDVSETGGYRITATVYVIEDLIIYEDVPAVADGTILAHVWDGDNEIGTAKMVLPINGVSDQTGIVGMGLEGAENGKDYDITFTGYKLWLMEK